MTEKKRIQTNLSRSGRIAYRNAKEQSKAFILIGNTIYRMSADNSKEKLEELTTTKVKVKKKKYSF